MRNSLQKYLFYISLIYQANFGSVYQIIEHQKSGGSWVANVISEYLGVRFVTKTDCPLRKGDLVRIHAPRQYARKTKNQVYVLRDGRDVLTSFYFHLFIRLKIPQAKEFIDVTQVRLNMPKYLEMYFKKQLGNKTTWVEHTECWLKYEIPIVRYENMLENSINTLSPVLEYITEKPVNETRLRYAIDKNKFEKVAGRRRGEENPESFHRKGIKGDYVNYFNHEAGEIFNYYAGRQLIELGYEKNDFWVQELETD